MITGTYGDISAKYLISLMNLFQNIFLSTPTRGQGPQPTRAAQAGTWRARTAERRGASAYAHQDCVGLDLDLDLEP